MCYPNINWGKRGTNNVSSLCGHYDDDDDDDSIGMMIYMMMVMDGCIRRAATLFWSLVLVFFFPSLVQINILIKKILK